MKKQTLLFTLARAANLQTRADYWRHINNRGRTRPTISVSAPMLEPGATLRATDRVYKVTATGAWEVLRRLEKFECLPAHKSQIRLLPSFRPARIPRPTT